MRVITIVWDYMQTYIKTKMSYRADFWLEIVSDLLVQLVNLLFIVIVFAHTDSLGGWSRDEMIFIYGYFMVAFGIFACFFNLWNFTDRYIIKGEMDRVLTRPLHNLVQLVLENLDPSSLFGALIGLLIMVLSGANLGLQPNIGDALVMVLLTVGSVMIYGGIYIALTAISFYSDSRTGILPLMYNIQNYGRYPVNIYNKTIRILLTWIVPFAFVGVYPAAYFLDKDIAKWFSLLTPLMGIVFLTGGVLFWNAGVKRYRGAGS